MSEFTPDLPFRTPFKILKRSIKKVNGVNQEKFTEQKETLYCTAKSYGGTEKIINDVYTIVDTLTFQTYYTPAISKGDKILLLDDNSEYEVLASPENINRANKWLVFKGERFSG